MSLAFLRLYVFVAFLLCAGCGVTPCRVSPDRVSVLLPPETTPKLKKWSDLHFVLSHPLDGLWLLWGLNMYNLTNTISFLRMTLCNTLCVVVINGMLFIRLGLCAVT